MTTRKMLIAWCSEHFAPNYNVAQQIYWASANGELPAELDAYYASLDNQKSVDMLHRKIARNIGQQI